MDKILEKWDEILQTVKTEHDVSDKDAKATLDNIYLIFIFLFPLSCYSFQFIS